MGQNGGLNEDSKVHLQKLWRSKIQNKNGGVNASANGLSLFDSDQNALNSRPDLLNQYGRLNDSDLVKMTTSEHQASVPTIESPKGLHIINTSIDDLNISV